MNIVPVVLAGGKGERFWPLSRSSMPKQLLPLISEKPMLVETLERVDKFTKGASTPLIVTSHTIAGRIKQVLSPRIRRDVIEEPVGKNTAPAVLMAALKIRQDYKDAVMLVLPADHAISPRPVFVAAVKQAAAIAARLDRLVIFGIKPERPDAGYGYIHLGAPIPGTKGAIVKRFVEKPDTSTARRYVASKRYLWNSGMFVWKASTIIEEFAQHMPAMLTLAQPVVAGKFSRKAVDRFYRACESISIDYAIMERSSRAAVMTAPFHWDDVGSWEAVGRLRAGDAAGNVVNGSAICVHACRDSIVVNNTSSAIAAVGLDNIVLVVTGDAVLAIHRDKLPDIKKVLQSMKADKRFASSLF